MVTPGRDRPHQVPAKIIAAVDRLARAQRSFRQAVSSRHGLTPLQTEILTTLADGPPPEPLVGRLALELGVTQPTISDSLRALESKRLVQLAADLGDRRRTTISLTRAGTQLVDELVAGDHALIDAIASIPSNSQEVTLQVLLELIGHLVGAGFIDVARTCTTCRFHQLHSGQHRCTLLDIDLAPAELRVNCPEHQPVASS